MAPRPGSRSPRRGAEEMSDEADQFLPEVPEWEGAGAPPPSEGQQGEPAGFSAQMKAQKKFLEQFLKKPVVVEQTEVHREFAAGLPLEVAEMLLASTASSSGALPWQGLPAHHACAAAALALLAQLVPQQVAAPACERYCTSARQSMTGSSMSIEPVAAVVEALQEGALPLEAEPVAEGLHSVHKMVENKPTMCCLFLDNYVAVLEDDVSGEETEEEVGAHCLLVFGGDLSGPRYCVYDPWGDKGGSCSYWSAHEVKQAGPIAWLELRPVAVA
mmetsp:Transcript_45618/g.108575  ORF Transcript_45618/g.108575 Transcript_45618/m.108575 type:complete len:273 (+) Transcript_45618:68-886(+)